MAMGLRMMLVGAGIRHVIHRNDRLLRAAFLGFSPSGGNRWKIHIVWIFRFRTFSAEQSFVDHIL
ncbi:MAG: hypothetical protein JO322_14735 [Candidatus Eremiobacteraeota bacterium]|nr:hypothetical protein [Candidatus Eremiobacteraeota bacterium]